ncbi:TIGR01440 family protein [Texcoconibacillus texcoconensis]|uniref:UPF0340 protein HNQ41_002277 n=1 Tax=Texcoconibacillus texcoconensis TaxID=1095777 RepID=A0A840QRY7_9BACI|nr:uncharacterized protein (TIGR01440 family) [Texcoconibacillus texcoconensis]
MHEEAKAWRSQLETILSDLQADAQLTKGDLLVIGTSTSEVAGHHIGTASTDDIARTLYDVFASFHEKTGVALAFQCCEHLNRALVIDNETKATLGLDEVNVKPVRKAGGSMAAHAYQQFQHPVVVEHIRADAGVDIGDTLIGMHLKHVAVPVRSSCNSIGSAHVTLARTRPKLIGGARAVYE